MDFLRGFERANWYSMVGLKLLPVRASERRPRIEWQTNKTDPFLEEHMHWKSRVLNQTYAFASHADNNQVLLSHLKKIARVVK